jgi:hypothetical protein
MAGLFSLDFHIRIVELNERKFATSLQERIPEFLTFGLMITNPGGLPISH